MQLQIVLCYSYIRGMNLEQFLKSDTNFIQTTVSSPNLPPPPGKNSDARLAECTEENTLFGDDLQEIRTKYNCQ
jgi:hypothetical protein